MPRDMCPCLRRSPRQVGVVEVGVDEKAGSLLKTGIAGRRRQGSEQCSRFADLRRTPALRDLAKVAEQVGGHEHTVPRRWTCGPDVETDSTEGWDPRADPSPPVTL